MKRLPLFLALLLFAGCEGAFDPTPVQRAVIVRTFPHDSSAFTQGLLFHDGYLYESTGRQGQSTIRQVRLADGTPTRVAPLPDRVFGEGITQWEDEIVGVTWRDGIGFRWGIEDFQLRSQFRYPGEGWGMTHDGISLILSDGTEQLRFLDPVTFGERSRIDVTANGRPVRHLNELEWVDGEIYANVWHSSRIARIDPATGRVKAWIELEALIPMGGGRGAEDVLNGIAYDSDAKRLFVTGKNWPRLFEIRLVPEIE
jgi:glutamine cyclotransferase